MQYIHHVHVTFNSRTNRNNIIVVHTAAQMNGASSKTVKGNSYDLQSYSKLGFTSWLDLYIRALSAIPGEYYTPRCHYMLKYGNQT